MTSHWKISGRLAFALQLPPGLQHQVSHLRDLHGYLATLVAEGRRTIPLNFIAGGDHVVVEARGEMLTRAGVPYNNEYCLVYRLKDGKIVEMREYCDSALTEAVLGKFPARAMQA